MPSRESAMSEDWNASAASGRKEIQIFRNKIQAGRNKFQVRRNEIQIKILQFPSPNLAFSMTYANPKIANLAAVLPPSRPGLSRPPTRFGAAGLVRALPQASERAVFPIVCTG
jgi:hypothetical protein